MSSRFLLPFAFFALCFSSQKSFSQVTIWQENFSGANQGWTQDFTDCDGTGSAGVQNGRFEVIDMEGSPCCPTGATTGGANNNEWLTNAINTENFCNIGISVQYGFIGTFECSPGGPYFACSGDPFVDNGHDQMVFEYELDNNGTWVQFAYICGGQAGTAVVNNLTCNSIRIRIRPANKAIAETYWFDNVTVSGIPRPTVNPVNDITACSGQQVGVTFSGMGTPPPTFSWTNSNTAIGLGAAGTGNINFTTPAGLGSPQSATITVTPTSAGCTGTPETFNITVNPGPTVDPVANLTVCPGDAVNILFSGDTPGATYNWTASLPIPGAGGSGQGNIIIPNVPIIPFPITATVTVTASFGGCTGPPQVFTVSGFPNPSGNLTLTGPANICQGQNAVFSVSMTNGSAPFTFVYALDGVPQPPVTANNTPFTWNFPITSSANVSLVSVTASNTCEGNGTGSANITVTPTPTATLTSGNSTACTGQGTNLEINFDGGNGTYTFVYRINGVNQPPITTTGPNYTLTVTPNTPGTFNYTLASVTSNGCTGTVGGSYSLTVAQSPTATLIGGGTVCAGQPITLTITFTGGGPYTVNYTANGDPQPPITTSSNTYLFSVAPATSTTYELTDVTANGCPGTVQGIAIVNVNPSPSGTLVSGNSAICNGEPVVLTFNFTGPSPYNFVYSVNNVNQPAINTSQSTYTLTVNPTINSTYTLVSVTGGGCNGAVNGTYTVTVGTPPTASISGDTIICPGDTANLLVNFTGTAPFTFVFKANGINQPAITTSNNPYILQVAPSTLTAYMLDSVASNGCSGTVSGMATVSLAPAISATISGGGQICTGGSGTNVFINFTGPGPYTFILTANNVPIDTITTDTTFYSIPVNPPNGTIYRLLSVSNGFCNGTVSGQAVVFVFTPPTAILSGDQTFCDSANTNVMIDFTGTGPFSVYYSINGIAQIPDTTFDDPYFIPIVTTVTTTITLDSIKSPGCDGIPMGSATITVNYAPSYTNLTTNCNFVAGTYTISFNVLGATLPLTLLSGSGTFTGTQFTSNPISIGQPYNFVFRDANDCGNVTVSGPSNCNCQTNAGTMNLLPIEVCVGETATATHNGNFVNDGDDILRFILHTNPALPIGTILGWNTTPSFTFGANMTAGVTYYISAIAGNNDGSGNVDLNDPCRSVSQGTPVTFFQPPTANIGPGDTICAGNQAIIPVTLTGISPFSLTWAINGVPQPTVNNITNSTYQIAITPVDDVTITLISVGDARCVASIADTAIVVVNTPPQVSNLLVTCDFQTQTYTLTLDVAGAPPYTVSGGIGGSFVGNVFTSNPIPVSSPNYLLTIADANMCSQATVSGTANCNCPTNAGTMSQAQVGVCENDTLSVPPTTGETLDADDELLYILHTTPGSPPGTILAWNNIPQFNFQPGMLTNTTYYVSAIAGNPGAPGQIDLNDPCVSIAQGTPVIFYAQPTADLVALDTGICENRLVTVTVNFTGTAPFSFVYSVNNVSQPAVTGINVNTFSFTTTYSQNTQIRLVSVSDQFCSGGIVQGEVNITIEGIPLITNVQTICDATGNNYTVSFTIQGGEPPYSVTGVMGTVTGNQFESVPIPSGSPYSINLSDANICGVTFLVGSYSCDCSTMAGNLVQTPLTLCSQDVAALPAATGTVLDGNDALIYLLVTTTNPSTWTILASNSTPTFSFNAATMSPNTPYFIVAVAGNSTGSGVDLTDICLSVAVGPTVTWRAPVTAVISGPTSVCAGVPTTLNVAFTGAGPFTFSYNNGTPQTITTSDNPYSLAVTPSTNVNSITLNSVAGAGNCAGTVSGNVVVSPAIQALNVQTICDFATQTYTLQFDISNGAAPNTTYTITGVTGTMTDTSFVSNPIPGTQPYNVTITSPDGCSTTIAGEANCLCTTEAGTLTVVAANACLPDGQVSVQVSGQVLDANDVLQYILYQDATQLPNGILAVSNTPQLGFQTGMTAGTTYFVSAIAGNNDGTGNVNLNDLCLSISPGVPVVFRQPPTATLAGSSSFCAGGNAAFQIQFTGTAPFKFVYAVNGNPQSPITAPGNTFNISTNNVQQNQVFTLISVEDAFCTGTVSGQADVSIIPPPTGSLLGDATICAGGSTTLGLSLTGGTSYDVTIGGGSTPIVLTGVQSGATVDVMPATTTTYTITNLIAQGNACPPVIGLSATVTVSDLTGNATVSNYNGFGVSCPNGDDGSITITPSGDVSQVTAVWNNGATGLQLNNLPPGDYAVTLTNAVGCTWTQSFQLSAPPGLSIQVSTTSPTCFGDSDGSLTVQSISGGATPFILTLNNLTNTVVNSFPITLSNLEAGTYLLAVADANDCVTEQSVDIVAPPQLTVDLGPDVTISFGDSIQLNARLNMTAFESFAWSPTDYLLTPDSLSTMAKPPVSQIYSITVIDTTGCPATDQLRIIVQKQNRVYLPNIIKPESNELNDAFTVYAGAEVARVRFMRIYDRWGELLFENKDFAPNDEQSGWRGRAKGNLVNPGVFVYVVEVEYFDGTSQILSGDVTVIR